jgi:hypothetical protein
MGTMRFVFGRLTPNGESLSLEHGVETEGPVY